MYLNMNKTSEDDVIVCYKITIKVWDQSSILQQSEDINYELKEKAAFCCFNKKTEEFSLNSTLTDPYFLKSDNWEAKKAFLRLLYHKRHNIEFPDFIEIAIG